MSEKTNNQKLKELVRKAGLTQPKALEKFNEGVFLKPLTLSAWQSYFCSPTTTRYRKFSDAFLKHAEKVFSEEK